MSADLVQRGINRMCGLWLEIFFWLNLEAAIMTSCRAVCTNDDYIGISLDNPADSLVNLSASVTVPFAVKCVTNF